MDRDLLLDCMSYLWTLSQRADDYWLHVASLEKEEAISYFNSLIKYPTQLGSLFGRLEKEESEKIYNTLHALKTRMNVKPSFFEISLWAILVDVKSTTMRREFFRLALEVDINSRRMIGAPSEMSTEALHNYIELAKKYISLSKHIHPAFSHSDHLQTTPAKKELASG